MQPIDVATRETLAFIQAQLAPGRTLIEVGCGDGDLAAALQKRGYEVMALDSERACIERARELGVNAVEASWPDFHSAPVDGVVFTRSLHHIHALEEAVAHARRLLKPGGVVLVEDFAFDEADARTIRWFSDTLVPLRAHLLDVPGEFVTRLPAAADTVAEWHGDHDHELHSIGAMTQAIARHFAAVETTSVPYLYRYLIPVLARTDEGARLTEDALREEAEQASNGMISLIGRRLVGQSRTATASTSIR